MTMSFVDALIYSVIVILGVKYFHHTACGFVISVMLFAFVLLNKFSTVGLVSHTTWMFYFLAQAVIATIVFTLVFIIDFKIYDTHPDDRFLLTTIIVTFFILGILLPSNNYLVGILLLSIFGYLTYILQNKRNAVSRYFIYQINHRNIDTNYLKNFYFNTTNLSLKTASVDDNTFIKDYGLKSLAYLLAIIDQINIYQSLNKIKKIVTLGNTNKMSKIFDKINNCFGEAHFNNDVKIINRSHFLNKYLNKPKYTRNFINIIKKVKPIHDLKSTFIGETGENKIMNILDQYNLHPLHDVNIFYGRNKEDVYKYGIKGAHSKLNNQIDVLVVNNNGIFPLEIKTYNSKKVYINSYGQFILISRHRKREAPNFHRQLDNHVWALRMVLDRHKDELRNAGIGLRDIRIESPLVFVQQNDNQKTSFYKDENAPADVNIIYNTNDLISYLINNRVNNRLNNTQVEVIRRIIFNEINSQKVRQKSGLVEEVNKLEWKKHFEKKAYLYEKYYYDQKKYIQLDRKKMMYIKMKRYKELEAKGGNYITNKYLPTFPHLVINNYNLFYQNYKYIYDLKMLGAVSEVCHHMFLDSVPIIKHI